MPASTVQINGPIVKRRREERRGKKKERGEEEKRRKKERRRKKKNKRGREKMNENRGKMKVELMICQTRVFAKKVCGTAAILTTEIACKQ